MLIIFDLDDTLIDTSQGITPRKLELAFKEMVVNGLIVKDNHLALKTLWRINKKASSAKDALLEFLEIIDADEKFFPIGMSIINSPLPLDWKVMPFDGAISLLNELKKHHVLALVSHGDAGQQMYKLKKAGIDSVIFSKIIFSQNEGKGVCYKSIIEHLQFSSSDTLVCGDRIEKDLLPAKKLGCMLVHVQQGRGLSLIEQNRSKEVDFTITHIKELKDVIVKLLYSSQMSFVKNGRV